VSWQVPQLWTGEVAAIFGGGPSLNQLDVDMVKWSGIRRIAVNNAYWFDLEADLLCWGDIRWWLDNKSDVKRHIGMKVTWIHSPEEPGIKFYELAKQKEPAPSISRHAGLIQGSNTGHGAINLAYLLGVKKILLLGFEMKIGSKNNFHTRHTRHANAERYANVFIPEMARSAGELRSLGVEVINCTPDSALTCFPMRTLEEALGGL